MDPGSWGESTHWAASVPSSAPEAAGAALSIPTASLHPKASAAGGPSPHGLGQATTVLSGRGEPGRASEQGPGVGSVGLGAGELAPSGEATWP